MSNSPALTAGVLSAGSDEKGATGIPTAVTIASYTVIRDSAVDATAGGEDTLPYRISRRRLRGEVTVVYSTRVHFPRLHIDENCETLDATPVEARGHISFPDALALGRYEGGRPCRVCCLEPVLRAVLKTRRTRTLSNPVLFTASAQSNTTRVDANLHSYNWAEASDSAQQRLRRVARTVELPTVQTAAGLVIYGIRAQETVDLVRMNLRTSVSASVIEVSEGTIQTLWTLLNDNPPELGFGPFDDTDPGELDMWRLASMLSN